SLRHMPEAFGVFGETPARYRPRVLGWMRSACSTARICRGNGNGSQWSPLSVDRNSRALLVPASTVFDEPGSVCTIAAGPPNGPNARDWTAAGRQTTKMKTARENRAADVAPNRSTNLN